MAPPSIPSNLHTVVLARAGEGMSSEQIASWLLEHHQLAVTGRAVRRLLERTRADRAVVSRAVLADKLGKTITTDLDAVQGVLERAAGIEAGAIADKDFALALKAQDRQLKALDLRLKLSGIDAPPAVVEVKAAREALLAKLDRLVEAERQASGPESLQ